MGEHRKAGLRQFSERKQTNLQVSNSGPITVLLWGRLFSWWSMPSLLLAHTRIWRSTVRFKQFSHIVKQNGHLACTSFPTSCATGSLVDVTVACLLTCMWTFPETHIDNHEIFLYTLVVVMNKECSTITEDCRYCTVDNACTLHSLRDERKEKS